MSNFKKIELFVGIITIVLMIINVIALINNHKNIIYITIAMLLMSSLFIYLRAKRYK